MLQCAFNATKKMRLNWSCWYCQRSWMKPNHQLNVRKAIQIHKSKNEMRQKNKVFVVAAVGFAIVNGWRLNAFRWRLSLNAKIRSDKTKYTHTHKPYAAPHKYKALQSTFICSFCLSMLTVVEHECIVIILFSLLFFYILFLPMAISPSFEF